MANDEVRPYSLYVFRTVLRDNYYFTLTCVLKGRQQFTCVLKEGANKNII